jgi:two-component system NtrC family response regulator
MPDKGPRNILLIDDDDVLRGVLSHHLEEAGYLVHAEPRGFSGLQFFDTNQVDLIVADLQMPEMDGLELIARIRAVSLETPIIIITAHGSVDSAVQAMKLGAEDFLTKPFPKEDLLHSVARSLERKDLLTENRYLRRFIGEYFALENVIGTSRRMRGIYEIVEKVACAAVTVLITGESGTGKELLAKAIHQNSPRSAQPFVAINCAAIPEGLLESEFFGHKKGSFTGANADAKGKIEAADGGTVFLDEIGDLPLIMQAKMLRVLQDGEYCRIGETTPRHADVRVIAATNRDLSKMAEDRMFREDLYFRLNIVPIKLPPLRDRREDIPLLADHFLKDAAKRYGKPEARFSRDVFKYFENYAWPGNVREFKNTIERMVVLSSGEVLTAEDVPEEIRQNRKTVSNIRIELPECGVDLEGIEKDIVHEALLRHRWNQTAASKFLNITRSMLISRMQKYALAPEETSVRLPAANP